MKVKVTLNDYPRWLRKFSKIIASPEFSGPLSTCGDMERFMQTYFEIEVTRYEERPFVVWMSEKEYTAFLLKWS